MVGDTGDPPAGQVRAHAVVVIVVERLVIDFADDRMLGTHSVGDGGDGRGDGSVPPVRVNGLERGGRVRQPQFRCRREKCCRGIKLTIINVRRIPVHQIAERRPGGQREGHRPVAVRHKTDASR